MTIEQIAIRQEIRQMLSEAGINKNTLKDMTKDVLNEELEKAVKKAINETDISGWISRCFDNTLKTVMKEEVRNRIVSPFSRMQISVDITDEHGTSSLG